MNRKGIILAGGKGSRLFPATVSVCKQLLPVYDKPLVYYPLSVLMTAGIKEILIICTPRDLDAFQSLFGDGSHLGIRISYEKQYSPDGLADAFLIGEKFIDNSPSCLILGDNIFYGNELSEILKTACNKIEGATILGYQVNNPKSYGVIEFDENMKMKKITEKPESPASNIAVTGLYFYDETVCSRVKNLKPSKRNELEITDLNNSYLIDKDLKLINLKRGCAWLDTGTHENLLEASQFIQTIEKRQGIKIACLEEISFNNKWIEIDALKNVAKKYKNSSYGNYLEKFIKNYV